jgi:hypothetical protein
MIIEFEVESGAKFILDKDLMTWERHAQHGDMHGKLYFWPAIIEVGKRVLIFKTNTMSGCGDSFITTPIKTMRTITRDEPDTIKKSDVTTV